jgi:hypothetical protein
MRLVVWNTSGPLTAERAKRLHDLGPDIAVLPEADPTPAWLPDQEAVAYEWQETLERRGLGVAAFGETRIAPVDERRSPWVLPVEVADGPDTWLLLATWTVQRTGAPNYAKQVAQIIDAYAEALASGKAVLAGDLNTSVHTADNRQHLRNVDRLADLGMVSAFHAHAGTEPDRSDPGTLYWQWKEAQPFHCDFVFVPRTWEPCISSVTIGSHAGWVAAGLSDHVPVTVEIDPIG